MSTPTPNNSNPPPPPPPSTGVATSTAAAEASALGENPSSLTPVVNEEELGNQLRALTQELKSREPLKTNYKYLLSDGIVTSRKPTLPKDKFYRRIGSRLRETVERYMTETQGKDPFDRIASRDEKPLEEEKMRAALTLREFKEHEQVPLLESTLSSTFPKKGGVDETTRKRQLDAIALGLQSSKKPRKLAAPAAVPLPAVAEHTEKARQVAELDQQREVARQKEEARRKVQQDERHRLEQENAKRTKKKETTPQQALHKFYHPIFKLLWDMEFPYLSHTNPFRMVIDRDNCAAVGAPDYFDVVEKPMNLTYIQHKVDTMAYHSLSEFFQDVDLMLQNAVKYNSDPNNPYRVAAEEMRKKYKREAKKVVQTIQKKHGTKS